MATRKEEGATGRGGEEINTNKEETCLKMEQAGILQEIRLRFRRHPRPDVTGVISAVRRRNPMALAVTFNTVLKTSRVVAAM